MERAKLCDADTLGRHIDRGECSFLNLFVLVYCEATAPSFGSLQLSTSHICLFVLHRQAQIMRDKDRLVCVRELSD